MATVKMHEYTRRVQELKGKRIAFKHVEFDFSKLSETEQKMLLALENDCDGVVLEDKKKNRYFNPQGLEQELYGDTLKEQQEQD